eukprot:CAMPEP_0197451534 /NCGR_PEP_ID=MMETSP1175-20131217/29268_1 /TAXON_ID=1003142 /ORGANISM="Triceratium dubium, Strain CCMP147" /LENGTH=33 /DNA_ID= /DNA_START= /DNA_END= /DNA_ORIENTATION=
MSSPAPSVAGLSEDEVSPVPSLKAFCADEVSFT